MKKIFLLLICIVILVSCSKPVQQKEEVFNPEAAKEQILLNGKKWGEALRKKDLTIISSIYDENAHYLADNETIKNGNQTITDYWKQSFGVLADLELNMESLEGTKEILYETGTGWVTINNEQNAVDTFRYNYCNVWKLQPDSTYKVVIDMFNDVPSKK
jgi:ketosteroid isomerase-like protein